MVRFIMEMSGERFWIWKFAVLAVALVILCLHINFKPARTIILILGFIYFLIILYQISLLICL